MYVREDIEEDGDEIRAARPQATPRAPTYKEWRAHMLTHLPYRSWCAHCVRGKKKEPRAYEKEG
eukprot:12417059-Karenia_brevis.AAC.1